MHFRKCGLDSFFFFNSVIITSLFSIATGQTGFKTHTSVNANRYLLIFNA